eukprot:CAMPEP_0176283698 /NCGR_PEP_ID=MMETSP0121_2-20121125/51452_1 /TAXON_ID=160619 /ORGANISM="Kryptoperidinium foliaceum, Strain CCMP 1326" /LENGTH=183 /DNA_ID=CAMNT_0017624087 /DNA_START=9 /DNA_END=560 /DNA_ORIENTATION=-
MEASIALSPSGECGDGGGEKISWASVSADTGENLSDAPTKGPRSARFLLQRSSGDGISGGSSQTPSTGDALWTCRHCTCTPSSAGCQFDASFTCYHHRSELAETKRKRACKGKRDRIKKATEVIERRVAENPEYLSSGAFFLPALVDRNPHTKARMMAQLSQVMAADAHRRLRSESASTERTT